MGFLKTVAPLAIAYRGRTRADDVGDLKVDEDCLSVLPAAVDALMVRHT